MCVEGSLSTITDPGILDPSEMVDAHRNQDLEANIPATRDSSKNSGIKKISVISENTIRSSGDGVEMGHVRIPDGGDEEKRDKKTLTSAAFFNLKFGLERGFLSMANLLLNVTLIGGGLMIINAGPTPRILGAVIVCSAIVILIASCALFSWRIHALEQGALEQGRGVRTTDSLIWLGSFTALAVIGVGICLWYAIVYPPNSAVWAAPVTINTRNVTGV